MFSRFRRPSLAISVCFAAAFALLVGLGVWQLQRLAWKEALLARIEHSRSSEPLQKIPNDADALSALEFHTATLRGRFIQGVEFHVTPRYYHGQLGYHIFAPFTFADGRVLLVNRGWVPTRQKKPESRPESAPPKGNVAITGMLRIEGERGRFTPISQPKKNIWFARDLSQMVAFARLENVTPVSLDIVGEQDAKQLPIPSDGTIALRNDHLQYAITWFLIALSGLIIFAVYHHKGPRA